MDRLSPNLFGDECRILFKIGDRRSHGQVRFILKCAEQIRVPVCEAPIPIDMLKSADEAFMSSTVVEVLGISSIDGDAIGRGGVGPVTRRLHEAFIAGVTGRPLSTPA